VGNTDVIDGTGIKVVRKIYLKLKYMSSPIPTPLASTSTLPFPASSPSPFRRLPRPPKGKKHRPHSDASPTEEQPQPQPEVPLTPAPAPTDPAMDLDEKTKKIYADMIHYLTLKLQPPFSAMKITMLIASGIKYMAQIKSLSGVQKKNLVLHAVREAIQNSPHISDEEKAEIIVLVDTFGDVTIDKLVEFAEDAYTFIKSKVQGCKWCPCLCASPVPEPEPPALPQAVARAQNSILSNNAEEQYNTLKQYLKLKLQRPFTAPKIVLLIAAAVKYMEQFKDLTGAEKKDIVIRAVRDIIQECDFITEEDKGQLLDLTDIFADETIDYLVDFGKHMYLKVKSGLLKCCGK